MPFWSLNDLVWLFIFYLNIFFEFFYNKWSSKIKEYKNIIKRSIFVMGES